MDDLRVVTEFGYAKCDDFNRGGMTACDYFKGIDGICIYTSWGTCIRGLPRRWKVDKREPKVKGVKLKLKMDKLDTVVALKDLTAEMIVLVNTASEVTVTAWQALKIKAVGLVEDSAGADAAGKVADELEDLEESGLQFTGIDAKVAEWNTALITEVMAMAIGRVVLGR